MIIYKATNKINNKIYIGQTTQTLEIRKQRHFKSARKDSNTHFHQAIRKYGEDNFIFEVIDETDSKEELNRLETYYITKFNSIKNGYNMVDGGYNNIMRDECIKNKHDTTMRTDKVRTEISNTMKKYRKEHPFTLETRQKISNKLKGNQHFKGHKLTEIHSQSLKQCHFKSVYCKNESKEIVARFDNVTDAARWWFDNKTTKPKRWRYLCNTIKRSYDKQLYVDGLIWYYDEGGDVNEKVN